MRDVRVKLDEDALVLSRGVDFTDLLLLRSALSVGLDPEPSFHPLHYLQLPILALASDASSAECFARLAWCAALHGHLEDVGDASAVFSDNLTRSQFEKAVRKHLPGLASLVPTSFADIRFPETLSTPIRHDLYYVWYEFWYHLGRHASDGELLHTPDISIADGVLHCRVTNRISIPLRAETLDRFQSGSTRTQRVISERLTSASMMITATESAVVSVLRVPLG